MPHVSGKRGGIERESLKLCLTSCVSVALKRKMSLRMTLILRGTRAHLRLKTGDSRNDSKLTSQEGQFSSPMMCK